MNKIVLRVARRKVGGLLKKYRGFRTIFLDDWRGFRLIYDTNEIELFPDEKFLKSRLFTLLKNEKSGRFSAALYSASKADKKLYGSQMFLNCKTYRQYSGCYAAFLLQRSRTKKQVLAELDLVRKMRILYSKHGNNQILEKRFRNTVVRKVLAEAKDPKRRIIKEYVRKFSKEFGWEKQGNDIGKGDMV